MKTSQARPAMRCKRLPPPRLKGPVEGASATVLLARAAADGHSPHRTESRSAQYRGLSSLPTKACTARRRALPDTSAAPRTLMLLTGPVWHRTVLATSSGRIHSVLSESPCRSRLVRSWHSAWDARAPRGGPWSASARSSKLHSAPI